MSDASTTDRIRPARTHKNSSAVPQRVRGVLKDFDQFRRNRTAITRQLALPGYEEFHANDGRIDPTNGFVVRLEHVHRLLHFVMRKWPLTSILILLFPGNANIRMAPYPASPAASGGE